MSLKKIFIIFLFSSYFFFGTSYSLVNAQSKENTNSSQPFSKAFILIQNAAKFGQTTLERWTEDQITSSFMTILRMFIGEVPEEFFTQIEQVSSTGQGKLPKLAIGGVIGSGTQMIATLFTPPASGIQYIANTWGNVLGKPAYAQGYGFNGLQFLLPLWKAARNIVYILSSIIFVVIGLMIILRVKISPQAVVTIQSAVPTVITTLILVTFSYAIAGLLIDIGNIILGIITSVLFSTLKIDPSKNLFDLSNTVAVQIEIIDKNLTLTQNDLNSIKPFSFNNLVNSNMDTIKSLSYMAAPKWWSSII